MQKPKSKAESAHAGMRKRLVWVRKGVSRSSSQRLGLHFLEHEVGHEAEHEAEHDAERCTVHPDFEEAIEGLAGKHVNPVQQGTPWMSA